MRLNKYIARSSALSRRAADLAIKEGRVTINRRTAILGDQVAQGDDVTLDGRSITPSVKTLTIMLNKPAGYVCSRTGQGSKTIYDLLPEKYRHLNPAGRLDKDSSGLLIMTSDGALAERLTHPRYGKQKIYQVTLNKTLELPDKNRLLSGVMLKDGLSKFIKVNNYSNTVCEVSLNEGRNRQIRRTFNSLGYKVIELHRTQFGPYELGNLKPGAIKVISDEII